MTNVLEKKSHASVVLQTPSSIPTGLQITHDVRLRQAQAETFARFHLAMMIPRSMLDVGSKLLEKCEDPDFAKAAVYRKPGSPPTEGLSIRFAEDALPILRNTSIDCSPEMEDEFSVHYRMTIVDMESNTPTSETFKVNKTVERRGYAEGDTVLGERTNSSGDKVYLLPATEDQMTTKVNAQKSKVRRNLILALIPAPIKAQCLARCKEVNASEDKKDPAAAIKQIVMSFLQLGVDVPSLKEYLGKAPQAAVAKEIEDLRGIFAMLRDGDLTWADVMEAKRETEADRGSKAAFVEQKKQERAKKKAQGAAKPPRARGTNAESGPAPGNDQPAATGESTQAEAKTAAPKATESGATEVTKPRTRASRRSEEEAPATSDSSATTDA